MDPKRTKALVTLLIALGAAKANPGANATASSSTPLAKPNIIVIMADDLGYGDVSCYGATAVQTPAIDRLALEGVRFTSGYCSASTCTPTRYSFLTGTRHNQSIHNGIGRIGFYTGGMKARLRDEDLADAWLRQAQHWIEQNRNRPFFLFFASHDIHVPRMPHERFQGKTSLGYRGDAIVELDWCVDALLMEKLTS